MTFAIMIIAFFPLLAPIGIIKKGLPSAEKVTDDLAADTGTDLTTEPTEERR